MELTNKYGAPVSIVAAIQNDSYTKDGADFSVTELISPPQIRRLWQEHEDEINMAELIVAKNRNGQVGTVTLWWDEQRTRFIDDSLYTPKRRGVEV